MPGWDQTKAPGLAGQKPFVYCISREALQVSSWIESFQDGRCSDTQVVTCLSVRTGGVGALFIPQASH
jgi:hypothetical protein